ncbi:MAG: hypothetical protein KatS3mg102_1976 [Planctomycetota bacterium]|nr:MAG: hypothetical protein KatS3mg102_1976 [Planctomycetota bacterium]
MTDWLAPLATPVDWAGAALFVLVFPVYHTVYPWLARRFPERAAKHRIDLYRRSWIERLLEKQDVLAAAHQTRNLAMVNSLLASSSLILMGFVANLALAPPAGITEVLPAPAVAAGVQAFRVKLYLLLVVFAVCFAYFLASLRHLGHFNVVIGADPRLVDEHEGSSVAYFMTLLALASNRFTLGTRCLYSAFPLFLWVFDPWLFLGLTVFSGVKFVVFQDFRYLLRRPRREIG